MDDDYSHPEDIVSDMMEFMFLCRELSVCQQINVSLCDSLGDIATRVKELIDYHNLNSPYPMIAETGPYLLNASKKEFPPIEMLAHYVTGNLKTPPRRVYRRIDELLRTYLPREKRTRTGNFFSNFTLRRKKY
jgi:hypothetical protein